MQQEKSDWKNNPFAKAAVKFITKIVQDPEYFPEEESSIVDAFYIPSTDLIPVLYERFGASSFHDLFPTNEAIDKYLEIVYMNQYEARDTILKELKVESKEDLGIFRRGDVRLRYVSGMYFNEDFTEEDLKMIVEGKKHTTGEEFLDLPNVVFRYMISVGEITGKDLIGLCLGNKGILEKCNDKLFIEQLRKEFGLNYKDVRGDIKPFEIYFKLYRIQENLPAVIREKKKVRVTGKCSATRVIGGKCPRHATGFNPNDEQVCDLHGARKILIKTVYDLMYGPDGYFPWFSPVSEASEDDLFECLRNQLEQPEIIETVLAIHRLVQVGIINQEMSIADLSTMVHEDQLN